MRHVANKTIEVEEITFTCDVCGKSDERVHRSCDVCRRDLCWKCDSGFHEHDVITHESRADYPDHLCHPCKKLAESYRKKFIELEAAHLKAVRKLRNLWHSECKAWRK